MAFFLRHVLVWLVVLALVFFLRYFGSVRAQSWVFVAAVALLVVAWMAFSRLLDRWAFWAAFAACFLAAFFLAGVL